MLAALAAITEIGYDRVTMRVVADALDTGPASLYAAWTSDAAFLHITGYCVEAAIALRQAEDVAGEIVDRREITARLAMLPRSRFPNTVACRHELTAGEGHARFDHTVEPMVRGLTAGNRPSRSGLA